MSGFSDQLEEIKSLISSAATKANKSFAYSTLLYLQQQSSDCHDSIQMLARSCRSLIRPTVADVRNNDEEITPLLAAHFHSLLLAIVHAIDNPIGSLSTIFEAIQAVMKLATLLSENMREMSHIWAPPVYRRLLSSDKRERDMSERCLLNTRSTILPPPLNLSKAVVKDLKPRLLTGMHHMLTNGMKLINQMLKIPEQTFSDHDSQIQIASQVAWEGLVDALVHPTKILPFETNATKKDNVFQVDPDGKSIWARNLCVDLLNDFILAKCKDIDYDSLNQVNHQLLGKTSRIAPFVSGSFSWKQCPMKWFPWDPSLLDFHLKMIYILICQASRETVSHDNRISAADASLRLDGHDVTK
ncbi:hypothetical protein ACFX1X_001691 [Malus domestica]